MANLATLVVIFCVESKPHKWTQAIRDSTLESRVLLLSVRWTLYGMVQILGGGKSNDKLWTRFWDRYHDLDRPEREMFVEFACFICGGEESSATTNRLTMSRDAFIKHSKSGSPRISLQNLIDKSFIVAKAGGMLSMHNHFCDMGRKIARERVAKVAIASAPAPNDDDG